MAPIDDLFSGKAYDEDSVFTPENLLREARRQKGIAHCNVPEVCVLDPDGDMLAYLLRTQQAELNSCWACYHTSLYTVQYRGLEFGLLACAVGSSFAVLIAEELFVSGCQLLISITSAGIISQAAYIPRFLLISQALRDEGTSYHYLPPEEPAVISSVLLAHMQHPQLIFPEPFEVGMSWTTDAPFRETKTAIDWARTRGAICVEMEAAALYAFAQTQNKRVVCFAHLTNTMAQSEGDFEKGEEMGSLDSLELIWHTAKALNT